MSVAATRFDFCIHVTSASSIASILREGLEPRIGPLSAQLETRPGIFMFPSWEDMIDASWLFDEAWPHQSEPALLCVDTNGLDLDSEAGFEVVFRQRIEPGRISVLAPSEHNWREARAKFKALGGRIESNFQGAIQTEPQAVTIAA